MFQVRMTKGTSFSNDYGSWIESSMEVGLNLATEISGNQGTSQTWSSMFLIFLPLSTISHRILLASRRSESARWNCCRLLFIGDQSWKQTDEHVLYTISTRRGINCLILVQNMHYVYSFSSDYIAYLISHIFLHVYSKKIYIFIEFL